MMDKLWRFLTSLRLTVVLLALGIVLVFVGTLAQEQMGLYMSQDRFFKSAYVDHVAMAVGLKKFAHMLGLASQPISERFLHSSVRIPVFPGGYLIGILLLINLIAAHIKRFQFTTKKIGIHLTHLGVILLLLGQLTTDLFSRETQLRFAEGETRVWSESSMDYELAFITDLDADNEQVIAIPQSIVAEGGEIKHEKLPFTVKVKSYWPNSDPSFRAPMGSNAPPLTTNGVAAHFDFEPRSVTYDMESKNVPVAIVELIAPNGSLGTWVVPGWAGDETMSAAIRRSYFRRAGRELADSIAARLTQSQAVEVTGKQYSFTLRPVRAYKPFSMTLLKTTHEVYPGTETPKDFRSRVRLQNPKKGEDREVEIYMNSPLRYAGLTFFQHQMSGEQLAAQWGETPSSVLQVVRNPSWLTPYVGCLVVGAGLSIQFLIHLVGFISRRKAA